MYSRLLWPHLAFSVSAILLIGCTPKEKSYNKGHNNKPTSTLVTEFSAQSERVSTEVETLRAELELNKSSAYSVYERLKAEVYESTKILAPESLSSEDTEEKVRMFNQAVLILVEDSHPELPTILQHYESALFRGCELNLQFRGCERLHLFKLSSNSALISLRIAQSYRMKDLWRYFDLIDLTFALKARDSSESLIRIYIEDFPHLYLGVKTGVLHVADHEQWTQRVLRFNRAICQGQVDRPTYSEETRRALARTVFSFSAVEDPFLPSVQQECLVAQLGESLISASNSEVLRDELNKSFHQTVDIPNRDQTSIVLPSIFEVVKTPISGFSIESSLHTPGLNFEEILSSDTDMYLFFAIDQSFHQGISTQFAVQLIDELQDSAENQEAFRKKVFEMIHSYMGHYLVSLAFKSHSELGAYFQSSTKTEVAFVYELIGRSAAFRAAWRNYQNKVEDLYEAIEGSLLNDFRGQQQELPQGLSKIQDLLLSAPEHVKFMGDIPAHIMLAVEMGKKNWNVDFRGSIYNGATEMRDLIDGGAPGTNHPKYSWFTFSRPQIEALGVPMTSHEVLYGFDYLFRLELSRLYGMTNDDVIEVVTQQYMASAFQQSRNNYHFDFINDRVSSFENLYNSSRMNHLKSMCQQMEQGNSITIDIHPNQFSKAALVGLPNSKPVVGKSTIAPIFGYLFTHTVGDIYPFGMRSDNVKVAPMYDNAEYVRSTALPRMSRVRDIIDLLSDSLQDKGEDAEGYTENLMQQFVYPHYSRVFNMMDIYENEIPHLLACSMDFFRLENGRRDHLLLGELEYYKALHLMGGLVKEAFDLGLLEQNLADLQSQTSSHAVWSHPFVSEKLSAESKTMNVIQFLEHIVNTPHPSLQTRQRWLKGVFARRKAVEFDPTTGSLQFNLTKQRFAYRARRYFESGFVKNEQLHQLQDGINEDFSRYPETYSEIENSRNLKSLFNSTGHKVNWTVRADDFMHTIAQKFYDKIIEDWYGMQSTVTFVQYFLNHNLSTSLTRSQLERMQFQRKTCQDYGKQEGCERELLSESLETSIAQNIDIFELLQPTPGQAEFLRTFGHPHIFNKSLRDNRGLGIIGYNNMRLFVDADVRPLPYFDYQYALFTSPFVGQSHTRLRGRIDSSNQLAGASFWEKKLDEFKRALDYFNSNQRPTNHFGLSQDGSIRVDALNLKDHKDRVQTYIWIVKEFERQVFEIGSSNMPPYAVFNNETPIQLPVLNPDVVQVVDDELTGFHCETENMFASNDSRCD